MNRFSDRTSDGKERFFSFFTMDESELEEVLHSKPDFMLPSYFENGEKASDYIDAANAGDANAQLCLGICYADGRGVQKSDADAVEWYRRSAKQGNTIAKFCLAIHYANEWGVPKNREQNDKRAFELYSEAAAEGYSPAFLCLGLCYANGRGVTLNHSKALECYMKDADNPETQYCIGICYEHGDELGLTQDLEIAKQWYRKSAANGYAFAMQKLKELASQK